MSTRWFTSDQHFGHRNIIGYSGRPYVDGAGEPDVAWMNTDLVVRHNMCVARGDEVWMLGDVVMGDKGAGLELVRECVGRKTLVSGNHDKCFRKGGRAVPGWEGRYAVEGGLKAVLHGTVELVLIDGQSVLLSHFPYVGDSGEEERFVSHRPVDDGRWLLHGHVHEKWRQRGRQINVGVDAWGGFPVAEEQVLELIEAGPQNLPPLPWSPHLGMAPRQRGN